MFCWYHTKLGFYCTYMYSIHNISILVHIFAGSIRSFERYAGQCGTYRNTSFVQWIEEGFEPARL